MNIIIKTNCNWLLIGSLLYYLQVVFYCRYLLYFFIFTKMCYKTIKNMNIYFYITIIILSVLFTYNLVSELKKKYCGMYYYLLSILVIIYSM